MMCGLLVRLKVIIPLRGNERHLQNPDPTVLCAMTLCTSPLIHLREQNCEKYFGTYVRMGCMFLVTCISGLP